MFQYDSDMKVCKEYIEYDEGGYPISFVSEKLIEPPFEMFSQSIQYTLKGGSEDYLGLYQSFLSKMKVGDKRDIIVMQRFIFRNVQLIDFAKNPFPDNWISEFSLFWIYAAKSRIDAFLHEGSRLWAGGECVVLLEDFLSALKNK